MKDSQILSRSRGRAHGARTAAAPESLLVFDVCRAGVVLRAMLAVQAAQAAVLLFAQEGLLAWLARQAFFTGGTLPATLLWLVAGCSLKKPLARLSMPAQLAAGVALGAPAGLFACALLTAMMVDARPPAPPWFASAVAGALLAAVLTAALIWRVRGRTPAATTARLVELQSRIRPHFLFNTLNSAIALVRSEPEKAERVLEDLADLFRHALAEQSDSATLEQEIELARRYLDIEQIRFGERLRVHWSLDSRTLAARLPPLILQPLVENAVKHGVEPSPSGALLRISTRLRGHLAVIKVLNTVPAGQGHKGHGIALANVRDRLKLLHDMEGSFRTRFDNNLYQARLEVPMSQAQIRAGLPDRRRKT